MKIKTLITIVFAMLICTAGLIVFTLTAPGITVDSLPREIVISRGMRLREVSYMLEESNLIRSILAFEITAKILGAEKEIKAGGYRITSPLNTLQLLDMLKKGPAKSGDCFTIPEGKTLEKIGDILAGDGYINKNKFQRLINDGGFAQQEGISAPGLEGYLMPETYCIGKGASEEDILGFILEEFKKNISDEDLEKAKQLGMSLHKIIILASIIEKEAADPREKPFVSAVFHNRLKAGMPLQSCATVIYALGNQFDGNLSKADLQIDSMHNTYTHTGLPPAPICSPGKDSIKAALNPATVDYLYFVSMNNGRHYFSSTLEEHNRAVREFQVFPD